MDYYDEIAELLLGGDVEGFIKWITTFDLLDQVEILRQAKELVEEVAKQRDNNQELLDATTEFGAFIERYQEAILTELLAKQELDMAIEQRDKAFAEVDEAVKGVRDYVIECIVTNADNAKEMRELANTMIQLEKDSDTYDPENWKDIL